MKDWSEGELAARWKTLSVEYAKKANEVAPLLQRLANIEKELAFISEEMEKRGLNQVEKTK
jgi:hypothetical protein